MNIVMGCSISSIFRYDAMRTYTVPCDQVASLSYPNHDQLIHPQ